MMKTTEHGLRPAVPAAPKILVVDDEIDVLRSTQMLLDSLGYRTIVVPEVRHLGAVIESEKPDLILQDMIMPGLDLEGLLRSLASTGRPPIPVVLFSASDDLPERAASLDAAGYLHKPFAEQQLREVLEALLGPMPRAPIGPSTEPKGMTPMNEEQRIALHTYFHEYRNTLTALNNYAQFLLSSERIKDPEREAVEEINRLVLDLEKRGEALRSRLVGE